MVWLRIRQHVDSERKLGEHFFPQHFLSRFSKSIQTISTNKEFPKCFHILKGFKVFQSSRNCFKYSEKQIGFSVWSLVMRISRRNLYNLHLLSNSSPRKRGSQHETGFSIPHRYHFDSQSSSKSKELRFRLLEINVGELTSYCTLANWHHASKITRYCCESA